MTPTKEEMENAANDFGENYVSPYDNCNDHDVIQGFKAGMEYAFKKALGEAFIPEEVKRIFVKP